MQWLERFFTRNLIQEWMPMRGQVNQTMYHSAMNPKQYTQFTKPKTDWNDGRLDATRGFTMDLPWFTYSFNDQPLRFERRHWEMRIQPIRTTRNENLTYSYSGQKTWSTSNMFQYILSIQILNRYILYIYISYNYIYIYIY